MMNVEENRLQTFNDWPTDAVVSPSRIAKAGFYYTKDNLTVECFSCHLHISDWNYGDQVMARHKQLSPQCAFVLNPTTSDNVPSISATTTTINNESLPGSEEDLKNEQFRLLTFSNWPYINIVKPELLAKAGFYYLKQRDLTKCAYCQGVVGAWQKEDVPDIEHQRYFPHCNFVISDILPRILQTNQSSGEPNTNVLKVEQVRLSTFTNWPKANIVTPQKLVKAGFYYTGKNDTTKCAYCAGEAVNWTEGDDPDLEHRRLFPNCSFVRHNIIPRLATADATSSLNTETFHNFNVVSSDNLNELGIQTFESPKKPNLCSVESRLRTFTQWPDDLLQTPDVLAQAGFYYGGTGDLVRCFHCDGGLQHWDPTDDPWVEHAKWFPSCSFLKLVKGEEFVKTQLQLMKEQNRYAITRDVAEQFLPSYMNSPIVTQALNIGLNFGRVRQAVLEKLQKTGMFFSSADALIEATLNIQRDEDEHDIDDNNKVAQGVTRLLNNFVEHCTSTVTTTTTNSSTGNNSGNNKEDDSDSTKQLANVLPSTSSNNNHANNNNNHKKIVPSTSVSLEEENRLLKEARLCKICMDNEVGIVFLPCGHLTVCVNCAPNLTNCPVCRSAIKATVRTFLS